MGERISHLMGKPKWWTVNPRDKSEETVVEEGERAMVSRGQKRFEQPPSDGGGAMARYNASRLGVWSSHGLVSTWKRCLKFFKERRRVNQIADLDIGPEIQAIRYCKIKK